MKLISSFLIQWWFRVSRKKETAKEQNKANYNRNRRVAECRLGAVLMWFDLFDGEFAHDQDRVMGYRGDGVDADMDCIAWKRW
jgi:hypothetical protein